MKPTRRGRQLVNVLLSGIAGNEGLAISGGYQQDIAQHWRMIDGYFKLVCSADAGNRECKLLKYIEVEPGQDVTTGLHGVKSGVITASQTKEYQISGWRDSAPSSYGYPIMTFASSIDPYTLTFAGYDRLWLYIGGGKAADTWEFKGTFQYLNYLLGMNNEYV